jgi:hypothetical protein
VREAIRARMHSGEGRAARSSSSASR